MARKPYTGGPLNKLNGKAGISAPYRSVPVSKLVRKHNPKSAAELEKLIEEHVGGGCSCGVISQGTIQDFGKNLYEAQKEYWGEYKFTLDECIQWEYDLFILQMLKGTRMEDKCKEELTSKLGKDYSVKDTSNFIDEELRVDLEVYRGEKLIAGIQVKPESFNKVRSSVQLFNKNANEQYGYPVLYADYNYEKEKFLELDEITTEIRKL